MKDDLRVQKTRENIQTQFLALLKTHEFKDITVRMLTIECRINRSTFYRNYEDKYHLLDEIIDALMDQFALSIYPQFISVENHNDPNYQTFLEPLLDYFEKNGATLHTLYNGVLPINLFDKMLKILSALYKKELENQYEKNNVPIGKIELKTLSLWSQLISNHLLITARWWNLECPELPKSLISKMIIKSLDNGVQLGFKQYYDLTFPS